MLWTTRMSARPLAMEGLILGRADLVIIYEASDPLAAEGRVRRGALQVNECGPSHVPW
jgi:hypothetical protein